MEIKYRGNAPRKIRISEWAGKRIKKENGAVPQPWFCQPFIEGSTYGLELIYTQEECRVMSRDGDIQFEGDTSSFKQFTRGHYGWGSGSDIQAPPDHVLRLEPHPRFFTDETGTVPLCVPGHLQTEWWPKLFFVVFKAPLTGQHIFKKGDPCCQILFLPKSPEYNIIKMSLEEERKRIRWDAISQNFASEISSQKWTSDQEVNFGNYYKIMSQTWNKDGEKGIEELFNKYSRQKTPKAKLFKLKKTATRRKNEP